MPNYRTTLALLTPYSVFLHSILKQHPLKVKVSSAGIFGFQRDTIKMWRLLNLHILIEVNLRPLFFKEVFYKLISTNLLLPFED